MPVSRRTTIDPETGWTEVWEREAGEGGWMLVSTNPSPPNPNADCHSCPKPGYNHGKQCWVLEDSDAE